MPEEPENLKDRLEQLASPGHSGSDTRATSTPESWRPRLELGPEGGFIVSPSFEAGNTPGAEDILRDRGLDPAEWQVTSLRKGSWQKYDGDWLESIRVNVIPARSAATRDFDLEQLVDEIKNWTPGREENRGTGNATYIHVGADQQLGKRASTGGTDQTVGRILQGTEHSIQRLQSLRDGGAGISRICIPQLGDHIEGNVSQHGKLQGQAASDLGQTEQVRVARRLLLAQIKSFAPLAEKIIVPVVNGNHDEVTRQVAADPADGWNVEVASAVQDACAENPELGHVEFRYPASGHQTLTLDLDGVMLGLFHGHQFSTDVRKYLSGQMLGQTALGGADVWISGHYHHFKSQDIGERLWLQAPTIDPGSDWFRDRTGERSKPGILTLVVGGGYDPREFIGVIPLS
ncbi:MAG: hypothetical protein ACRC5T_03600 [Cetobacterium sp.]